MTNETRKTIRKEDYEEISNVMIKHINHEILAEHNKYDSLWVQCTTCNGIVLLHINSKNITIKKLGED